MSHPIMFREDDPGLARVREIALGFPSAVEKISWGRPVFCVPKIFLRYGGSSKPSASGPANDRRTAGRKGEYIQYPYSILVKVDDSDRRALEQDRRCYYPAYLGPSGWLGLDLSARKTVNWDEVGELIDASFRLVAPKKVVKLLDES